MKMKKFKRNIIYQIKKRLIDLEFENKKLKLKNTELRWFIFKKSLDNDTDK